MSRRLLALVVGLSALLAGCGGEDGDGPSLTLPPDLATILPTRPPATEPPTTEPPATEPPATETTGTIAEQPTSTQPPATEPPATEPPVTEPPATEPPATEPPVTEPPATEPPATEPPATEPPATEPPATEPPASEPPTTEPTIIEEPADDDDDGVTWWPWILGLAAVGGIAAVLATRGRRAGPMWPERVGSVLDESDQLTTHLAAATPEGLRAVAAADGARLAALGVTVGQVVADAPDDLARAAVAQLQAPLAELHATVDAISLSPAPPTPADVGAVRARASQLHASTASVRAYLQSTAGR